MIKYYRLMFDIEIPDAWYLSTIENAKGEEILPINFSKGMFFDKPESEDIVIKQYISGQPVDYRHTTLNIPVVSDKVIAIVQAIDKNAVQFIPVKVIGGGNEHISSGFYIMNVLLNIKCLDYDKTQIETYSFPPEKVGQISSIYNIKILPNKAGNHHIFRLAEWHTIIIISQFMKEALETNGLTGLLFMPL